MDTTFNLQEEKNKIVLDLQKKALGLRIRMDWIKKDKLDPKNFEGKKPKYGKLEKEGYETQFNDCKSNLEEVMQLMEFVKTYEEVK